MIPWKVHLWSKWSQLVWMCPLPRIEKLIDNRKNHYNQQLCLYVIIGLSEIWMKSGRSRDLDHEINLVDISINHFSRFCSTMGRKWSSAIFIYYWPHKWSVLICLHNKYQEFNSRKPRLNFQSMISFLVSSAVSDLNHLINISFTVWRHYYHYCYHYYYYHYYYSRKTD